MIRRTLVGVFVIIGFTSVCIADDAAIRATLSSGVVVELIGIGAHPSEGNAWWKPDGRVVAKNLRGAGIYEAIAKALGE